MDMRINILKIKINSDRKFFIASMTILVVLFFSLRLFVTDERELLANSVIGPKYQVSFSIVKDSFVIKNNKGEVMLYKECKEPCTDKDAISVYQEFLTNQSEEEKNEQK